MPTTNALGLTDFSPLSLSLGGTNADLSSSMGVIISQGGTDPSYCLTGDVGTLVVYTDNSGHVDIIAPGASGTVLTSAGTSAIPVYQALPSSIVTYNNITGSTVAMAANNGYIINTAGACTLTLPSTCALGTVFYIYGANAANIWHIAQNASQSIYFGAVTTTSGTGGYLQATAARDCVSLICTTANTQFLVTNNIGTITYN